MIQRRLEQTRKSMDGWDQNDESVNGSTNRPVTSSVLRGRRVALTGTRMPGVRPHIIHNISLATLVRTL